VADDEGTCSRLDEVLGDAPMLPHLLNQIPRDEQIGSVTADGAYDTCRCHNAIAERWRVP
tara:strand:+ start:5665 stop:5844 length:180 start_codon:yes stop_codon:yes gene_type:complete